MMDVKTMGKTTAGLGSGVVDSNRFYSMLLDARTASVTESMHDIAEKLLRGEKDNAKLALDQLWTLKKTLSGIQADETIENMISYYQEKINVLREKEENIKKVSKDTRYLIEEKKRKDDELSNVKIQIGDCTRELENLGSRLEVLKKREDDLARAERQLKKEISANEGLIVNGLHDIILRRPDQADRRESSKAVEMIKQAAARIQKTADQATAEEFMGAGKPANEPFGNDIFVSKTPAAPKKEASPVTLLNNDDEYDGSGMLPLNHAREVPFHEPIVYPKSVVRMGGKIIGEYYHDGNIVTKEERHYIYNSRFMAERVSAGMNVIKNRFSQEIHAELIKIAEDAAHRVRENPRFHFEVSTNEILNEKNLKQLSADLRRKVWDDAERFAIRLNAKIEALGLNYEAMLQEQMERCAEIG